MDNKWNKLYIAITIIVVMIIGAIYTTNNSAKDELTIYKSDTVVEVSPTPEPVEMIVETIQVHITGQINNQGVYTLNKGARLNELVELAGGVTEEADLRGINLSRRLEDEDYIVLPAKGEISSENTLNGEIQLEVERNDYLRVNLKTTDKSSLVNINLAEQSTLETLPGIGSAIAANIISYREKNGGFENIEEIKQVDRIGTKTYEKIKDFIYVD